MLGDYPHTRVGPWRAKSGGRGGPRPPSGGVPHPIRRRHAKSRPPDRLHDGTGFGVHHWGDLCTADHQVKGERTLKKRAPDRKGIPGLRVRLARQSAVVAPLLRAPPPQWQAAPKGWIVRAVPTYPAEAGIGGRVAKTTRVETVYDRGCAIKVTTAMKETMEAENCGPELRVCCRPPDTLPSDTMLHRLPVALLGVQVQSNAPLHAQLWDDHQHVSLGQLQRARVSAPTIVWLSAQASGSILAMGPGGNKRTACTAHSTARAPRARFWVAVLRTSG